MFSATQLQVLEKFFERKRYGTYTERDTLATMLKLEEQQVQVQPQPHPNHIAHARNHAIRSLCLTPTRGAGGEWGRGTLGQKKQMLPRVTRVVPEIAPGST